MKMKYYYIKGDGFNVPVYRKVLSEEELSNLFLDEEIECLKNSIGDKESIESNLQWIRNIVDGKYKTEEICSFLQDFGYIVRLIDEKTYYQFTTIRGVAYERFVRTSVEDKKELIEFLKDVVKTFEDDLLLHGEDIE